jgi:4-amino-4-deoxy-L-arabinose transferase-like glycosyltransferase
MRWSERLEQIASAGILPAVLVAAFTARAWSITAGLPHAVGIDEPAIIDRALRILNTNDWNPHTFDYPTLVIYLHTLLGAVVYIGGAIAGRWSSLDTFDIVTIYTCARLFTVVIGVFTVWLTYRIAEAIGGRLLAGLAAVQLALLPLHVRESHFALTDVPVTALTTLAIWLSMRAAGRTPAAYAAAGAVCGLAAAAKYNGVIACVAPATVWLVHDSFAADRWRKAGAASAAAAAAFLVSVPYVVLDLPAFLNGFAAQASRFAAPPRGADPVWLVYLKHLALTGRLWLPLAAIGLVLILRRRQSRVPALPLLVFTGAYFYVLATHSGVFGRYALPILPAVCILAAASVSESVRALRRRGRPVAAQTVLVAAALAFVAAFTTQSAAWLRQFAGSDTRTVAAHWMTANLPKGARVVVEIAGPAYLRTRGFDVIPVEVIDQRVQTYRDQGAQYLVLGSRDVERIREYLEAGPILFHIEPTASRWGPPVRVVQLDR